MLYRLSFVLLFMLGVMVGAYVKAEESLVVPFTSDGCSSFPDGTFQENELWLGCCRAHDYAYWRGGSYQQRLDADKELKACVERLGQPKIALLMLVGVRVGGTPFVPTGFRWGYGWPYPRMYGALSEQELEQLWEQERKQNLEQEFHIKTLSTKPLDLERSSNKKAP